MRKLLIYFMLGGLALGIGSVASAAPTDPYDFMLAAGYGAIDTHTMNLDYCSTDKLTFDYWYDPVIPAGCPEGTFTCDLKINRSNNDEILDENHIYRLAQWRTVLFGFEPGASFIDNQLKFILCNLMCHDEDYAGQPAEGYLYVRNVRVCDNEQPVPEPGTMAAFGAGLIGLIGFEIRKRKNNA